MKAPGFHCKKRKRNCDSLQKSSSSFSKMQKNLQKTKGDHTK